MEIDKYNIIMRHFEMSIKKLAMAALMISSAVIAKVQSTESSNRMEGVITTSNRIKSLMAQKTTPRNRDEKEIAGYRDVLNTIHENHQYIPIRGNYILQLHRDLMQYTESPMGGRYKAVQNYLEEEKSDNLYN